MSKLNETLKNRLTKNLKNLSIAFDADLLDKELTDKLSIYLSTDSITKIIELSFAITSTKILVIDDEDILEKIQYKPAKELLQVISQEPKNPKDLQYVDIPRWMILSLGSTMSTTLISQSLTTTEEIINNIFRLCLDWLQKVIGNFVYNKQKTETKSMIYIVRQFDGYSIFSDKSFICSQEWEQINTMISVMGEDKDIHYTVLSGDDHPKMISIIDDPYFLDFRYRSCKHIACVI